MTQVQNLYLIIQTVASCRKTWIFFWVFVRNVVLRQQSGIISEYLMLDNIISTLMASNIGKCWATLIVDILTCTDFSERQWFWINNHVPEELSSFTPALGYGLLPTSLTVHVEWYGFLPQVQALTGWHICTSCENFPVPLGEPLSWSRGIWGLKCHSVSFPQTMWMVLEAGLA